MVSPWLRTQSPETVRDLALDGTEPARCTDCGFTYAADPADWDEQDGYVCLTCVDAHAAKRPAPRSNVKQASDAA